MCILRECPFCGTNDVSVREAKIDCESEKYFAVMCETCGLLGSACEDEAGAISSWEYRV